MSISRTAFPVTLLAVVVYAGVIGGALAVAQTRNPKQDRIGRRAPPPPPTSQTETHDGSFEIRSNKGAVTIHALKGKTKVTVHANGKVTIEGTDVEIKASDDLSLIANDDLTLKASGDLIFDTEQKLRIESASTTSLKAMHVNLEAQQTGLFEVGTNLNVKAGIEVDMRAPTVDVDGSAKVDIDGKIVTLN